ncbi:MAG TPA: glycosyltransferase family 4 protein [Pyrinomonadaceae bacterium]|nr:glycosyltransferase family 4 protein [Pyrinomonadaceae bacterium]
MTLRLAILVSHPIQHFAPWHREVAKLKEVDLRVFFYSDLGVNEFFDPEFQAKFSWDIPLLDGYGHEFLPIRQRPKQLAFWEVDNPTVGEALDRFAPDVVKVFGYAHRTTWRVAKWASVRRKPLLLYSDSNDRARPPIWKQILKRPIVSRFYSHVDGALFVGNNNFAYHRRYGLPPERLFRGSLPIDQAQLLSLVPNRSEVRRDIRLKYDIPQDAFVVMFCGKYSARKRPVDVIAAAHMTKSKGIPAWSLMVGEGSERASMEEYCRVHNVTNTTLTGFVNQTQIAEHYVASDVIVVSSENDPHPLVVSEAATFGLPALVSDQIGCIGNEDTARPGVSAVVYPCGNREQLAALIEAIYHDSDRYRQLSLGASEISVTQDVTAAARDLALAAQQLLELGPR